MLNRSFLSRRRSLKLNAGNPAFPHTPFLGDTISSAAPYIYRGLYGSTPYNLPYTVKGQFQKQLVGGGGSALDVINQTFNNPISLPSYPAYNHPTQGTVNPSSRCEITLPANLYFFTYLYTYPLFPHQAEADYQASLITLADLEKNYPDTYHGVASPAVKFSPSKFIVSRQPLSIYGPQINFYPDALHHLITDGSFFYSVTSNALDVSSPTPTTSTEEFCVLSFSKDDIPYGYIYKVKAVGQGIKQSTGTSQVAFLVQYLSFSQLPYKYVPVNPLSGVVNFQSPAPSFQKEYLIYAESNSRQGGIDTYQFFETRSSGFNLTFVDYNKPSGYPTCFTEKYFCVLDVTNNIIGYSLADGSMKPLGPFPISGLAGSIGTTFSIDTSSENSKKITFQGDGTHLYVMYINNINQLVFTIYDNDLAITKTYTQDIKGDPGIAGFNIMRGNNIGMNQNFFLFSTIVTTLGRVHLNIVKFTITPDSLVQSSMNGVSTQINISNSPTYTLPASDIFVCTTTKNTIIVKANNNYSPLTTIYFP